jgi:uracil-DNA glycosylase
MPNSHAKIGWQYFTDEVIKIVSYYQDHVVFILMGEFAKSKKYLIDVNKHAIIETTHPASRAPYQTMFQNSNCFSVCNNLLEGFGKIPVYWNSL